MKEAPSAKKLTRRRFLRTTSTAFVGGTVLSALPLDGLASAARVEIVDLTWANGKATSVRLRAKVTGEQKLRPPRRQEIVSISESGKRVRFAAAGDEVARVTMNAGKEYRIRFR